MQPQRNEALQNLISFIRLYEAWNRDGPLLVLVTYHGGRGRIYRYDVWHGLNLGVGHEFLGSAFVEAIDLFEGTSIDARVESMESDVFRYLKEDLKQPDALSFSDITRTTLSWKSQQEWPKFTYQKGTDWIILCRYLMQFLGKNKARLNPVQQDILTACDCIDYAMGSMYDFGIWIPAEDASKISSAGLAFLQLYQKLACTTLAANKTRFTLTPKQHSLYHVFKKLYNESKSAEWAYNPLAEAVPPNEDFIGRVSRSSRRVSNRTVSLRTLQAHLIQVRRCWRDPYVQEPWGYEFRPIRHNTGDHDPYLKTLPLKPYESLHSLLGSLEALHID